MRNSYIIRFYTHDEKEAFYYFFKLLDEFLQRDKSSEREELSLTKSNNHSESSDQSKLEKEALGNNDSLNMAYTNLQKAGSQEQGERL